MSIVKLAIQKDGRMTSGSLHLLERCGIEPDFQSRVLLSRCLGFPMEVLSVRDDDIPEYVQNGVSDLGIVGENVLIEKGSDVQILERLGFARCKLSLAVSAKSGITSVKGLIGKRIATSYPRALSKFLLENGIDAQIVEITGAVEIAPTLGLADGICDLISTGNTARLNGLEVLCPVFTSEAILIGRKDLKDETLSELIDSFIMRIRSTARARKFKYVMMNAPASAIDEIRALIPGMKEPSVLPLTGSDSVAVHSVVAEDEFWEVISKLKAAGATDLIATTVEALVP